MVISSNVERVRLYYELVDGGDVDGLIDLFAPHAEYHRPGYQPLVGHANLERFYRDQRVIKEGRHVVAAVVEDGDDVAVQGRFDGVLRDGTKVVLRFADFFHCTPQGAFARRDTYFFQPLV